MTDTDTVRQHIEIVQGAGGPEAVIAGHRIRVQDVVIWHERLGMSPEEIVEAIPTITLADVHAALASYWDNRDELERQIGEGRAFVEEFKQTMGPSPLEDKLRRRIGKVSAYPTR
jgi:uncharacterized protein (DUF433 family)